MTSAYQYQPAAGADDDGGQGLVSLVIDGVQLDLNHTLFTYTEDPVINDVQPATSFVTFVCCCLSIKSTNVEIAVAVKSEEIPCWNSVSISKSLLRKVLDYIEIIGRF